MVGGRGRDRTGDPLLAKQVLSQLSYTPTVTTLSILGGILGTVKPSPGIARVNGSPIHQTKIAV
jgi:hypothetical protein